ncbi:uncharacterized protein LAESUDRAFT_354700 [Laetiporus sulphureus 93-53]|uniref:Uncharacterized protein n=1 Tax=Laetiporus sulphureus 93-53 TaxID=1314785 RepID=A0A165GW57_9APHY|nr:uncharacterized protein LAESUDRAFT_354700 [Laetiporus sulphureus 93-53]KZT10908.1 hypothetical protein LAESUDRAFT_354700 [Laetiporus sulphureus 93-53]
MLPCTTCFWCSYFLRLHQPSAHSRINAHGVRSHRTALCRSEYAKVVTVPQWNSRRLARASTDFRHTGRRESRHKGAGTPQL